LDITNLYLQTDASYVARCTQASKKTWFH